MVGSIGSSLSALQAASQRVAVSADNLANQNTTKTRKDGEVENTPFVPKRVVQVANGDGSVSAKVEPVANPAQKIYAPDSPDADEAGFLSVPNVDQAAELVNLKIASYDYKANLKAIAVQDKVQQSLLDILT